MQIVVFEDEHVSRLYPITVSRPAYAVTCASYRLIDWLARLSRETGIVLRGIVRPHLEEIQRLDFPAISANVPKAQTPTLLVNARLVPSVANYEALKGLLESLETAAVYQDKALAAAMIGPRGPAPPPDNELDHWLKYLANSVQGKLPAVSPSPVAGEGSGVRGKSLHLFDYPHDLVRHNLEQFSASLAHRLADGSYQEIADGVFAAPGASLGQYCVTDTTKGPLILDEGATVGPHCFLRGPAYLGPRSRVIEHSAIKDAVSLGHTTKIGGEIEASVVEPYTNKQHHGFLGHSYLGSWINLGAGTSNSDLKNTYGNVKMEYRGTSVATEMQFVGCFVGDYSKSAINTGIFTGKTVGCCSMMYGFVTTNVPSFVNYARFFGQVTELPPEVMVATQQRMFSRRKVEQREADVRLIHAMYDLTRHERQLAGEPLALEESQPVAYNEDGRFTMSTALRLTLDDYDRMIAEGAFDALRDKKIELIYGELREMTPPGPSHSQAVSRLNRWSHENTTEAEAIIRIQDPIGIPELDSAPQPDVVWVRPKDYGLRHPRPREVLLLIEVSDSSLDYDLGEKAAVYAQAGIKDYWVVNIPDFCVEVFRQPKRGRYLEHHTFNVGEQVQPLAFSKLKLSVSGLFSGTL